MTSRLQLETLWHRQAKDTQQARDREGSRTEAAWPQAQVSSLHNEKSQWLQAFVT